MVRRSIDGRAAQSRKSRPWLVFAAEPADDGVWQEADMDCVKCAGTLKSKVLGKVIIDSCASCRGIWFDKQELRQANDILKKASAYFAQAELDRPFRK